MEQSVKSVMIWSVLMLSFGAIPLFAQERPSNNKFGIHLAKPADEDIDDANALVNGNGGSWGYVTLVMQEDDRNKGQWQGTFDKLRELKLIPIIRIATKPEGGNWRRPSKEDAEEWANFLDSLHWVVKERYVILFNEPNHATEWGGSVDAQNYTEVAKVFAEKLHAKDRNFVVMMAGLDDAAPSAVPSYEDSGNYIETVVKGLGDGVYENLFDAVSSHSYANPAFAGSPNGYGKGSVRSYQWQLNLLKELGVEKDFPIFITETGWDAEAIGRDTTAVYLENAFNNVWLPDNRVKAVTPFILNYQGEPFLKFSFRKLTVRDFYPQYDKLRSMKKVTGKPQIEERGQIVFNLPKELVEDSNYHYTITVKNDGEGYWASNHGYKVVLTDGKSYFIANLPNIKPFETKAVDFYFKTDKPSAMQEHRFALYRNDERILESIPWKYRVMPLPSLNVKAKFFPKLDTTSNKFEIQIFDDKEELVYKKKNVQIKDEIGEIRAIRNISIGKQYRIVILHPNYLPRQTYITFTVGENNIEFERMLPFDFNGDGALDWTDVWPGLSDPSKLGGFMP